MMSELRNNAAAGRYEMDEQGQTSWADYREQDGRLCGEPGRRGG